MVNSKEDFRGVELHNLGGGSFYHQQIMTELKNTRTRIMQIVERNQKLGGDTPTQTSNQMRGAVGGRAGNILPGRSGHRSAGIYVVISSHILHQG